MAPQLAVEHYPGVMNKYYQTSSKLFTRWRRIVGSDPPEPPEQPNIIMEKLPNNLQLWESLRGVPDSARRLIQAGNLKGKTDINPVWRMKMLTETFGPIGFGWNVREVERWTNECAGEVAAFVKVELTVCMNGGWSQPIEGTGGSKLCGKGRGDGINDEAWKMATTDAISVACKSLGMAADIYFEKDAYLGTKYDSAPQAATKKVSKPVQPTYRQHPTESQILSMAKRIAAGERLTSQIQTNFLMTQQEWLWLDAEVKKINPNYNSNE